jgi:hypothetical protein
MSDNEQCNVDLGIARVDGMSMGQEERSIGMTGQEGCHPFIPPFHISTDMSVSRGHGGWKSANEEGKELVEKTKSTRTLLQEPTCRIRRLLLYLMENRR